MNCLCARTRQSLYTICSEICFWALCIYYRSDAGIVCKIVGLLNEIGHHFIAFWFGALSEQKIAESPFEFEEWGNDPNNRTASTKSISILPFRQANPKNYDCFIAVCTGKHSLSSSSLLIGKYLISAFSERSQQHLLSFSIYIFMPSIKYLCLANIQLVVRSFCYPSIILSANMPYILWIYSSFGMRAPLSTNNAWI